MKQSKETMRVSCKHDRGSASRASDGENGLLLGEEGSEMVEFSITAMIVFTMIFGMIELCLLLFFYHTAAEASRETARWLSVQGIDSCAALDTTCIPSSTAITNYVQAFPGAAQMTPTVSWCSISGNTITCSGTATASNAGYGNLVQVQVTQKYTSIPFITKNTFTVSSTSQMVIWQ